MKGAPTILFGCLWFLLFLFVAAFAGSDGFSTSGGCNPLIVCALVCPSVFCKIIAQSIYGRTLHVYKINLPDARVLVFGIRPCLVEDLFSVTRNRNSAIRYLRAVIL